ncbi:hypothetical protein [Frankia sp. AgB32]|uniref:hypothetical protein n=1 Tax=Frankia sp. AgB32 TaxID=631119 RepID=UPI00200D3926|nr:hypothetical protein [Frankia sp. AgB32]MCK9896991.1 hypothetical protein [Frankia sp. AgB32]
MHTADTVRAAWDAGSRADILAVIDGGGVDLDDHGRPLDDQWDLIAGQLDTAPAAEIAGSDQERDISPATAAEMAAVAGEMRREAEIAADIHRRRDAVATLAAAKAAAVQAGEAQAAASAALDLAIAAAHAPTIGRLSYREIARTVGLSHQRVAQIYDEQKELLESDRAPGRLIGSWFPQVGGRVRRLPSEPWRRITEIQKIGEILRFYFGDDDYLDAPLTGIVEVPRDFDGGPTE